MGVPLDDTWIHFQFADNFANGNFFEFNPGEPTAGTTSPLYVIIMGITSFIIPNFIVNSLILSGLFYILSCIFVYKISLFLFQRKYTPLKEGTDSIINSEKLSLLASMLTVFAGRFAWASMSGMETTLFTFFTLVGVYFHLKELKSKTLTLLPSLFFAFSAVLRPEGMLLYSLYALNVILNLLKDKAFKQYFIKLFSGLIIFLCIVLPYFIFSYLISGHFFPNTFRGQGGGFSFVPNFTYLKIVINFIFRDNFITGSLLFIFIYYYFSNLKNYFKEMEYINLIALWTIFLPLISSVLIPNWRHHVRYTMPLIPFINIIAVYYLIILLNKNFLHKLKSLFYSKKYAPALIVLFSLFYYFIYAAALGKNVDNINSQQVKIAEWVKNNVGRDETIALNDIGAITFISKNRIIDMAGLVTPEILEYRKYTWDDNLDSLNYLLKKNDVSYIVIYDHWFKEYLQKYGDQFTFITSAILEENTICGGIEMKVYKTNFSIK